MSTQPDAPRLLVAVDLVTGRIALRGDLDRDTAHHLLDAVDTLAAVAAPAWELDASGVTFCDAGGLRALLSAAVTAARSGRTLALLRPSRCVDRLVGLVGLDDFVREAVVRGGAAANGSPRATLPVARPPTDDRLPTERRLTGAVGSSHCE